MGLAESLIFYLLIGLGVAAAVWLSTEGRPGAQRLFPTASAVLFWPMYVPLLLNRPPEQPSAPSAGEPADSMTLMIAHVEAELDAALASLDGWAEETLGRESVRIAELKAAWSLQAARIREMDRLLSPASTPAVAIADGQWPSRSEEARQENLQRLKQIRQQAFEQLTATLAWVRELVSKIHLAKFSGASAAQAEELVAQIAAAVEGISEVTSWRPRHADEIHHAG